MSKRKRTSKRWTAAEAREVLEEQRRSGLSVAAYAKKHGVVSERLYRWRNKLEPSTLKRRGRGLRFAEVTAVSAAGGGDRFEVTLASGRRVSVPGGFDDDDMRRLVAVLEEQPC